VPGFGPEDQYDDEAEPHPYAAERQQYAAESSYPQQAAESSYPQQAAESSYPQQAAESSYRQQAAEPEEHPYAEERQNAAESPYARESPYAPEFADATEADRANEYELRSAAYAPDDREPAGYAPEEREPAGPGLPQRVAAGFGAADGSDTAVHADGPATSVGAPWGRHAPAGLDWERSPFATGPSAPMTGPVTDIIELSGPRDEPVNHRGEKRRRALVVTVAAVGVLVAGGAGYAIFQPGSSNPTTTVADTAPTTDAPTDEPLFPDQEVSPSAAPAKTSASPSASVSSSASPSASASPSRSATSRPASNPNPTHVLLPPKTPTARPATTPPTTPANKPLTAKYSFGSGSGSVTISNPNGAAASNWTVRLTVTGDNTVSASGASADRSGDTVTFRGGAVAANGSLTFSFSVSGTLDTDPSGCSVNGNACS
jgi:hypothetical protein